MSVFAKLTRDERAELAQLALENDPTLCRFVSSKGLMRLCETHQSLPNDARSTWSPRALKNHHPGGRVYVHPMAMKHFRRWGLRLIRSEFVLVSGDNVIDVSPDGLGHRLMQALLAHPKMIRWHAQNLGMQHPKLHAMPLGLDYHTLSVGRRPDWGAQASPLDQEAALFKVRNEAPDLLERKIEGYSNWQFEIGNGDRADVIKKLPADSAYFQPEHLSRTESWARSAEHFFTISPRGRGMDCHRTWEAILLGSVPIIPDLPINSLFADLPVVVVRDWTKVTPDFLEAERARILEGRFDFSGVFLEKWRRQLFDAPALPPLRLGFQDFARLSAAQIDGYLASGQMP